MYFWKISKLEEDLIHDRVSQRDIFLYILTYSFLTLTALEIMSYLPKESPNTWDYLDSLIAVLVGLGGIFWAFRWNGGSVGKRFAERYFSIGWVMLLRFFVLLILVAVVLSIFWLVSADEELPTTWWEVLVFQSWYLAYCWRVAAHMRRVAAAT